MAVEDTFNKLLDIEKNSEVDQNIAEGFQNRQIQREKLYAQQENSSENFDFYREYAI